MTGRLFIGTAAWSIPRNFSAQFPADGSQLARYSKVLGAVEINTTFYRRHRVATFERWRDTVPEFFRFAVKMPRSITHEAALVRPQRELAAFFDDIRGLGSKLGPVLVQLPASLPFERRRVTAFFRSLRALYAGAVVCEPRHPSWYDDVASAVLIDHDIARVIADPPRPKIAAHPGGSPSLLYFRWHGSPRTYWSSYDDATLAVFAKRVQDGLRHGPVWCIFDNTAAGAATGNALGLASRLKRAL